MTMYPFEKQEKLFNELYKSAEKTKRDIEIVFEDMRSIIQNPMLTSDNEIKEWIKDCNIGSTKLKEIKHKYEDDCRKVYKLLKIISKVDVDPNFKDPEDDIPF